MASITACEVPAGTLLDRFRQDGGYADCYTTEVAGTVSQAEYVEMFYTTTLFKAERWLLARLAAAPSTDAQARELAQGTRDTFAAWRVEGRSADEVLLAAGRTRSWLMVVPGEGSTRLLFGSAVMPQRSAGDRRGMGLVFTALLGFHKLYSRALLRAASARLRAA